MKMARKILSFQVDRPVFVKYPFRVGGKKLPRGEPWDWKKAGVSVDRARNLFKSGFLYQKNPEEVSIVPTKTKWELLREELDDMIFKDLQDYARERGIRTTNSREFQTNLIIEQLQAWEEEDSPTEPTETTQDEVAEAVGTFIDT